MSNITLPTERRKAQSYNPRLLILVGKPKAGKSTLAASLENNLIIDLEDGYRALDVMVVNCKTAADIFETKNLIQAKIKEDNGKLPYRFITIDNATRLEEFSLPYAAALYRKLPMSKGWGMKKDKLGNLLLDENGKPIPDPKADVRQLPNGAGYTYQRQALKEMVNMFKPLCETLILVCHVKDKQIRKNDEEWTEMGVELSGKVGDIICGEADAIGYVRRDGNNTILSFKGGADAIRGSRPLHLREKEFIVASSDEDGNLNVNLSQIFLDSTVQNNTK